MVDVTVNLDRAYEELRSIDTDLAALNGRSLQDRTRKRIASDDFAGFNRSSERRVMDVGGRRRIVISTDNNGASDRFDNKKGRFDDGEDFQGPPRRSVPSSVVMPTIETKSRDATLSEMKKNEKKEDKIRNKRLFGNLLVGTLRQFQKEEKVVGTHTKVQVEKQREVERRLEQSKTEDKQKILREKEELLRKRQEKEREIQRLRRRKAVVQYSEEKIKHYKNLQLYIQTQAKPALFYLPAKHTLRTLELLKKSADKIDTLITARREQTERDLRKDEGGSDDESAVAGVRSAVVSVDKLRKSSGAEKDHESESDYDEDEVFAESSGQLRSTVSIGGAVEEESTKPGGAEKNGNKSPDDHDDEREKDENGDEADRSKSAERDDGSEAAAMSGEEEEN